METSDVRKRVKLTIDRSRRAAAARRSATEAAAAAYDRFLRQVATPLLRQVADVLKAEKYPYQVFTPAGAVRLASDRTAQDFIELRLDTSGEHPAVMGHVSRARGSRVLTSEQPIAPGTDIADLTDDHVLEFLLREIAPFVER